MDENMQISSLSSLIVLFYSIDDVFREYDKKNIYKYAQY